MQPAYPVYVDVLFLLNFIIDYLLLSLLCRFCGRRVRLLRLLLAAAMGGLSGMVIFLPPMHHGLQLTVSLGVSALMVAAANPHQGIMQLLREWFAFLLISFTAGGLMYGVFTIFNPRRMTIYNGVLYFDISAVLLLFNIIVIYVVITLFDKLLKGNSVPVELYTVQLSLLGRQAQLRGLVDTGNSLKDAFSDVPVVVCSFEAVKYILPAEVCNLFLKSGGVNALDFSSLSGELASRFRLIPYRSVGCTDILPAFKVDYIRLIRDGQSILVEEAFAAICTTPLGEGYDILLNPKLIPVNKKGVVSAL